MKNARLQLLIQRQLWITLYAMHPHSNLTARGKWRTQLWRNSHLNAPAPLLFSLRSEQAPYSRCFVFQLRHTSEQKRLSRTICLTGL